MEGAAPHLKPVILELGGKDPLVLMDDADIDAILPMALKGKHWKIGG
jgi:vanillin dehydrogenase